MLAFTITSMIYERLKRGEEKAVKTGQTRDDAYFCAGPVLEVFHVQHFLLALHSEVYQSFG